jgi:hypothetical protein
MTEKNFSGYHPPPPLCRKQAFFERTFPAVFVLFMVLGALSFTGCPMEGSNAFVDYHKLNPGLIGTWKISGDGWTDTYQITAGTGKQIGYISHPDGFQPYNDAVIEYVYNFDETSGCIIMKYTDGSNSGRYNAVYFKDILNNSVLLGDAYDTAIPYPGNNDSSVSTLTEAKEKFAPKNAEAYGGGGKQEGTPQIKQP